MNMYDSAYVTDQNPIHFLLKEAKKLHRYTQSDSLTKSLPVLRRLIATHTFREISLKDLHRQKNVKRKHILHMLAIEAGYKHWAEYKNALTRTDIQANLHYSLSLSDAGHAKLWFASYAEALEYQTQHGGEITRFGNQAVIS